MIENRPIRFLQVLQAMNNRLEKTTRSYDEKWFIRDTFYQAMIYDLLNLTPGVDSAPVQELFKSYLNFHSSEPL